MWRWSFFLLLVIHRNVSFIVSRKALKKLFFVKVPFLFRNDQRLGGAGPGASICSPAAVGGIELSVDTDPGQKDMGKIILGWIMCPGNTNTLILVRLVRLLMREVAHFKFIILLIENSPFSCDYPASVR